MQNNGPCFVVELINFFNVNEEKTFLSKSSANELDKFILTPRFIAYYAGGDMREGERCGYFYGPPNQNNAGECKAGLFCEKHPTIEDLPGRCKRRNIMSIIIIITAGFNKILLFQEGRRAL